jgi:hypothetical protein
MTVFFVVLGYAFLLLIVLVLYVNWEMAETELEVRAERYDQLYDEYREYRTRYFAILPYAPIAVRDEADDTLASEAEARRWEAPGTPQWEYSQPHSVPSATPFDQPLEAV